MASNIEYRQEIQADLTSSLTKLQ